MKRLLSGLLVLCLGAGAFAQDVSKGNAPTQDQLETRLFEVIRKCKDKRLQEILAEYEEAIKTKDAKKRLRMIKKEKDFNPVRNHPKFKEFMNEI